MPDPGGKQDCVVRTPDRLIRHLKIHRGQTIPDPRYGAKVRTTSYTVGSNAAIVNAS